MSEPDDDLMNGRGSLPIERLFDHIVRAVTVAAIIGGAVMLSNLSRDQAVIQADIRALASRVEDLRILTADRYTQSEAESDLRVLREEMRDHEARIRALERPSAPSP